jgi:hypothetical protein
VPNPKVKVISNIKEHDKVPKWQQKAWDELWYMLFELAESNKEAGLVSSELASPAKGEEIFKDILPQDLSNNKEKKCHSIQEHNQF